jgi:hypothetical protein
MQVNNSNEVIVERLDTLIKQNTKDHISICERLDFTNGKVRKSELWRHSIIAMGTVITGVVVPLVLYIVFDGKKEMEGYRQEHMETADLVENLSHRVDFLDK